MVNSWQKKINKKHVIVCRALKALVKVAGEMAEQLEHLLLLQDPGLIPRTHIVTHNIYHSSSRGADTLFWFL